MTCCIADMYWERTRLHIRFSCLHDKQLFLRKQDVLIPLKWQKKETSWVGASHLAPDNSVSFDAATLDMSTIGKRDFLENGLWELVYLEEGFSSPNGLRPCVLSDELLARLDDFDRVFRYGDRSLAYTVTFVALEGDEGAVHLGIESCFMKQNDAWRKHTKPRSQRGAFRIKMFAVNFLYSFLRLFYPNKEKNVLFLSEVDSELRGNLAALLARLRERGLDAEFNVEVSCRESLGGRSSSVSWFQHIKKIARAGIIIIDNYAPLFSYLKLDGKTRLVQVWHAGLGFKSVGYARFGKEGSPHPAQSVHRKYDLALSPSEDLVDVFSELFGIEEDAFISLSLPRLDDYLQPSKIDEFKSRFYRENSSCINKRIVLFAPTYRGKGQSDAYYDYEKVDFSRLYEFCGTDTVFLVKMHPFIKSVPSFDSYAPRIYDVSHYTNINELFYVTDIFITDYSSAYFEFSIFKKPLLFYTYDRLRYEGMHGVHQSVHETAPGKVCDTFDELLAALEVENFELDKTRNFSERHFPAKLEGSSDILLDRILFSR